MRIPREHLIDIFKKVKFVKEHTRMYILGHDHIPVSIDDLTWVLCDMYRIEIELWSVNYKRMYVPGLLARFEGNTNKSRILISHSLDENWKRFVTTKELSHLLIDQREDWCPDGVDIIEALFSLFEIETNNGNHAPERRIANELLAETVAIEILYPHECREADKTALSLNQTTLPKLELRYGIPLGFISQAHSASYSRVVDEIWSFIRNEQNA